MMNCMLIVINNMKNHIMDFIGFLFRVFPKFSLVSSIFGFLFIFFYLINISKFDLLLQIDVSIYGIGFIFLFFLIFISYVILPFFCVDLLLHGNALRKSNKLQYKGNELLYSINQSMVFLLFLNILFIYSFAHYDDGSKFLITIFWMFFLCLLVISFSLFSKNVDKKDYLYITAVSLIPIAFFFFSFVLYSEALSTDYELFSFVILYLFFLIINNLVSFCYCGEKYDFNCKLMYRIVFVCLILFISGDSFKLQRLILKPSGMAQYQSQSGWYLIKNRGLLDFVTEDYLIKYNKSIDDGDSYYIKGYLIFNIGSVRVICPHDFEQMDEQKPKNKKLSFSKCLSLTSDDIKFMEKDFLNDNKGTAMMEQK